MAIRAFLAERKLDKQFIEREGKIYMERIQDERMRRQGTEMKDGHPLK